MADTGVWGVAIASVSGAFSIAGLLLQQANKRKQDKSDAVDKLKSELAAQPDLAFARLVIALDRSEKQAADYAQRLEAAELEIDKLRRKISDIERRKQ